MENRDIQINSTPELTAGALLRTLTPADPDDSLGRAAFLMRSAPMGGLPVVRAGLLVGWLDEAVLTAALAANPADQRPVSELADPAGLALTPLTPLLEAAAALQYANAGALPVVAPDGLCLGVVLRADVAAALAGRLGTTRQIGGMATPLGVYLTDGSVSGGAGWLGLLLTGVVLAVTMWVAQLALTFLLAGGYAITHLAWLKPLAQLVGQDAAYLPLAPLPEFLRQLGAMVLLSVTFFALFRYLPVMGRMHAGEHQTVNALEAGEPLTPEAVARMPRVHPRCGTNLIGIGMLGYLGLSLIAMLLATPNGRAYLPLIGDAAMLVVLVIALTWRTLGAWLQTHITTRPATAREIASGIAAARELFARANHAPVQPPTLARRLWNMGLHFAAIGLLVAGYLLPWLQRPLDALWQSLLK
jgi:CBS domain-containing protein